MSQTSNSKIRFFSNPRSRARIVRWMLEECGADYETVNIEFGSDMKSAQYLAINPMGKVPALQHGDAVITETGAIVTYLADSTQRNNWHLRSAALPVPAICAGYSLWQAL